MKLEVTKVFKLEIDAWVNIEFHYKRNEDTAGDFYTATLDNEDMLEFLYNNLENNKRYRLTFEQLSDDN